MGGRPISVHHLELSPAGHSRRPPALLDGQQILCCDAQFAEGASIAVQLALGLRALSELKRVVALLHLCKIEESLGRKEQALVMESAFFANPGEHREVGGGRRPKARNLHVYGWARMSFIDGHRLHLQSNHAPGLPLPHENFGGFRIWKWTEQVHVVSLGEASDDFLFPEKP